jgi:hypothetical protein
MSFSKRVLSLWFQSAQSLENLLKWKNELWVNKKTLKNWKWYVSPIFFLSSVDWLEFSMNFQQSLAVTRRKRIIKNCVDTTKWWIYYNFFPYFHVICLRILYITHTGAEAGCGERYPVPAPLLRLLWVFRSFCLQGKPQQQHRQVN